MMEETTGEAEPKVCIPPRAVNEPLPLVILWDIDGTLLSSDGAGKFAMEQTFRDLFGVHAALREVELAGRTDEAILEDAAAVAGLTLSAGEAESFRTHYARVLADELASPRRAPRALPGVEHLLATLDSDRRFVSGLLTGNWRDSARIKLASVGLGSRFAFGAFAGDAPAREGLLPVALERASRCVGRKVPAHRAIIVGDTPRDVSVATAHGARAIAVATGPHSFRELAATRADLVVEDLGDPAVMTNLSLWSDEA